MPMNSDLISRRAFACRVAVIPAALGTAARAFAAPGSELTATLPAADGLSHSAEAIRQELPFDASRTRVYQALTVAEQFDAVTRLSDAVALVNHPGAQPTTISGTVGGPFTLFGGYITGRHLELVPGERLVQAWRAASWEPGDYSVVRFELVENGAGTKVIFSHRGFPDGAGTHLAEGWHSHYWAPLTRFLVRR